MKADNFIGSKFNDDKLIVVGISDRKHKSGAKIYKVHCIKCAVDRELFGDALFESSKQNLITGSIPCGCSKPVYWTSEQYKILIHRKITDKFTLIDNNEISSCKQRVELKCNSCDNVWRPMVIKVLNGNGCPKCAGNQQTISPIDAVLSRCAKMNVKFSGFVSGNYETNQSRLLLTCHCGCNWNPTYNSYCFAESGCPECAKSGYSVAKPGWFYLVQWVSDELSFLKYGITNLGISRIEKQKHNTKFKPYILFMREFECGQTPLDIERLMDYHRTQLYGCNGVVSKSDFSDGYTETLKIDQINWINQLLSNHLNCKINLNVR